MIYTKLSAIDIDCEIAQDMLGIDDILEYTKLNIADRQFEYFTEAIMAIGFFADTLFVAPTLNNDSEHVLGVYLWDEEEVRYTGLYFYETKKEYNQDSILWICFEEPRIG